MKAELRTRSKLCMKILIRVSHAERLLHIGELPHAVSSESKKVY